MKAVQGRLVSGYVGAPGSLKKAECDTLEFAFDGIVGDRHRGFTRSAWDLTDKQPGGTERRNERQWSAVSVEELADIGEAMDLTEPLTATCLGANLCIKGVRELSRLPKGTVLKFPSGAELIVEEFNPPCHDMGKKLASIYTTRSGAELSSTAFSKAAKLNRGVVGVVEVGGTINAGDEVSIESYETPSWLARSSD